MLKRFFFCLALICALTSAGFAQNANSSGTTRSRTTTAASQNANATTSPQEEPTPTPTPRASGRQRGGGQDDPSKTSVLEAFNALVAGIKAASVDAVTGAYWNSPQLVLFNN